MIALRCASRVQSESLRHEGYLWSSAQELEPLVRAVGQHFREEEASLSSLRHRLEVQGTLFEREGAVEVANESLWERCAALATDFGPALRFLSPAQRGTLVRRVVDLPDEEKCSMAIKSLGRELAHLEVPQRENLVNTALSLTDDKFKVAAITGLFASLEHLGPSQRDELVAAAIALRSDLHRASALQALGPKLALLKEAQCVALARTAADLTREDYAKAVMGLFKGLADLDPDRRQMIINTAVEALDRMGGLWPKSVDLLPGVEYFSESQRAKIIASARAALPLYGDSQLGSMIAQVAPALDHMGKPYRDAMFNRAIHAQRGKAEALRGLGMCIAHLDEAQQEALLRAARSMPSDEERAHAIGGMAAGVVHLGEDGRNTLIFEVNRLEDDHARDSAIRDFGESLQHLSPGHRQELVAAATSVGSIIGLAKGLRYLAQPERELLLAAAQRLDDPRDKAKATVALAKATSEALLFREPDMLDQ